MEGVAITGMVPINPGNQKFLLPILLAQAWETRCHLSTKLLHLHSIHQILCKSTIYKGDTAGHEMILPMYHK